MSSSVGMAPRHQLVVSVGLIAAVIAVAWFVLFRQHILAPPVTIPAGPSLPDIGRQFEAQVEAFNRIAPTPSESVPPIHIPAVPAPGGSPPEDGRSASGGNVPLPATP